MGKKAAFLAGVGVGYFFGTKAGRARYEQIKTQANRLFHDEHVRSAVGTAKDRLTDAADTASDAVKQKVAALKDHDDAAAS